MKLYIISSILFAVVASQQYTTPVPILKQINKHNEDGSYSYGYEAADGTFKIESKFPNGEVYGKYGYLDDQGKLREIEYGATRRGFEPAGNEINVPPPTLVNNKEALRPLSPNEEDDGQYREDPSVYYKNDAYANTDNRNTQATYTNTRASYQPQQQQAYQPQEPAYQPSYRPPQRQQYQEPEYQEPAYQEPAYQQPAYQQPAYQQPAYQQPAYQQPRPVTKFGFDSTNNQYNNNNNYNRHPATNVDYISGSYSVNY